MDIPSNELSSPIDVEIAEINWMLLKAIPNHELNSPIDVGIAKVNC